MMKFQDELIFNDHYCLWSYKIMAA